MQDVWHDSVLRSLELQLTVYLNPYRIPPRIARGDMAPINSAIVGCFQAEFTFLLEQVWLDTEEGKA